MANFQSPYASFRLLLEASEVIEKTKDAGARLATIIVDPVKNRWAFVEIAASSEFFLPKQNWNVLRYRRTDPSDEEESQKQKI